MQKVSKGFTLIELMVVVAIIGILAAIAVPNFVKFQCRSKQSEARGNLKAMYVAQESYKAEFDSYGTVSAINGQAAAQTATNQVGFVPKGNRLRYIYSATSNAPTTGTAAQFEGQATGGTTDTNEMTGDLWTVSELNDVCNSAIARGIACTPTDRTLVNSCD